ncbi:MAG: hypothetical protein IKL90_00775 [Alphaproteobacteria bacterium]|nr:hypothetical protein [Alphaproteobacteria bacterium]
MTIALIVKNNKYINELQQNTLLLSFFNTQQEKDIFFVENENIFSEPSIFETSKRIVVASLMCLADSMSEIKTVLLDLYKRKISLVSIKENLFLLTQKEMKNFILGFDLALQLKVDYSSFKIKSSLQKKKEQGIKIGRLIGAKNKKKSKCAEHHQYIFQALKNGEKITTIANTVGVTERTLFNYKKEHFPTLCLHKSKEHGNA